MRNLVKITLMPSGQILEIPKGANLLRSLQDNQIPVGSSCGGNGLCASCKIAVMQGNENLSEAEDRELDLAERNHLGQQERLSCQCTVNGPITITTSYW